jgi:peptidoglycan/xylan/chitin deacetylase (PgdA/CDA1 family)
VGYAAPPSSVFQRDAPRNLQLTIDDGPAPVLAALRPILAEIATRKVVAAFFVIGEEVVGRHSSIAEIRAGGHIIGNHSWDHFKVGTSTYSDTEVYEQFARTHAEVKSAGYVMQHWRAPRGEEDDRLNGLISSLKIKPGGRPLYTFTHCDWNANSKDADGIKHATTAAQMIANIEGDLKNQPRRVGFRLLFHVVPHTAVALKEVLDHLVSRGHKLVDFTQSE